MALFLVGCASCAVLAEETAPVKKEKNKEAATARDDVRADGAAGANIGLKAFGNMIPLGSRSRGVRIPAFDDGKPSSLIIADAMTRVDDSRLFAEKMVIHVFAEKKEEDMQIDLKTGIYNIDQQILSSNERSRVSRPDFQIEGDALVYDTKTSQGKMVGNVEMIIHDAGAASRKMKIQSGGKTTADGQKSPGKPTTGNPVEKK